MLDATTATARSATSPISTAVGGVDMADFELFRAALRQAEQDATRNLWPRADLNGSGKLSRDPADKRKVKGAESSDLDVMMGPWQDRTVPAEQLPG